MTIIKRILLASGVLLLLFVIVGFLLPTSYTIVRSVEIDASPARIHEYTGDLEKWPEWAPWKDEDPSIVVMFGDKTVGVGANQSWIGQSGDGSLRFTSSSPDRGIEYDLFFEGGKYRCESSMSYVEGDNGTTVTWTMDGDTETPVIGGYLALMMDSMVGGMFERGLLKLIKQVESNG